MCIDDQSVWFAASCISVAEWRMQLALDRVSCWTGSHGFRFSLAKTVAMHFCCIRGVHPDPDLFMSKLEYGCEVYSSATYARLRILDPVHQAGVYLATGAFSSSPIPSLLVDANEPPLDLHRQSFMVRCWH
ncbi:hypothetical protein Pmani_012320 [Petrolisthes manimaculis]|uniref:Uncharacterized protein n=1 Tax=Petrolisthes manimaculis TaxID=1843537 RepID=A0AAE1PXC3_9EUCA|nr:hypothetical protein Pmani_012320 [Petrolisthes manimaculis]